MTLQYFFVILFFILLLIYVFVLYKYRLKNLYIAFVELNQINSNVEKLRNLNLTEDEKKLTEIMDEYINEIIPNLQKNKKINYYYYVNKRKNLYSKAIDIYEKAKTREFITSYTTDKLKKFLNNYENKILNSMPEIKNLISEINKNNSLSVWRGFIYSNIENHVMNLIKEAKDEYEKILKMIEDKNYIEAEDCIFNCRRKMMSAILTANIPFEVEKNIKKGKSNYKIYKNKIDDMINKVEEFVKNNTNKIDNETLENIKVRYNIIINNYNEYKKEISMSKNPNEIDWILIGSLLETIVNQYKKINIK